MRFRKAWRHDGDTSSQLLLLTDDALLHIEGDKTALDETARRLNRDPSLDTCRPEPRCIAARRSAAFIGEKAKAA